MSSGSKLDLLLAKGGPISDSGSISVIMNLRRGRKCATASSQGQPTTTSLLFMAEKTKG